MYKRKSLNKTLGIASFASLAAAALLSNRNLIKHFKWIMPKGHVAFGVTALMLAAAHAVIGMYAYKKIRKTDPGGQGASPDYLKKYAS